MLSVASRCVCAYVCVCVCVCVMLHTINMLSLTLSAYTHTHSYTCIVHAQTNKFEEAEKALLAALQSIQQQQGRLLSGGGADNGRALARVV
jgi:hypothetical protein